GDMAAQASTGGPPTSGDVERTPISLIAWPALAMMMVASVGSIAQLSDSATFGLGAVTVYLLPALLFLLPVGLVSAELATSHEGGIFVWVREAFGDRTGFQATWFVFMNSVTLYPSLLSFGAAALATALGRPDLAGNGAYMGAVVLVGFWAATFVVSKGMKTTAGLSNLGVGLGTIVPALALIFFMFAWLVDDKPSATPLEVSDLVPPFTGLSSIALVVGTFVAFAGLEVNAVHIKHLKGRPKSYFKAVLSAAALVFVMYMLGSIAISVAVPDATLELTSGASQAFTVYTDGFGIPGLSNVLSGLLVLGAVAASIAWIAGPSRSMWLVGRAGYLPQRFQKVNGNDVQMPILLFQGVIVTILSLVFVVAPNTSAAFAVLQDISIILYMGMYVCMFASAIRLRRSQPDVERPIRIKGLVPIACVGIAAAVSAIVLGLTPPSGYSATPGWVHALIVVVGVAVLAIPAQILYRLRRPEWASIDEAEVIAESEE
ncbi:MAG TPA: APC family permease, partial [Ornithinibacter sp.]|nr:APC family permease [Ornithinibacter sp.]